MKYICQAQGVDCFIFSNTDIKADGEYPIPNDKHPNKGIGRPNAGTPRTKRSKQSDIIASASKDLHVHDPKPSSDDNGQSDYERLMYSHHINSSTARTSEINGDSAKSRTKSIVGNRDYAVACCKRYREETNLRTLH